MRGSVVLPTYSRPELLDKCLESLYGAERSHEITKVVVLQPGNQEVERLVHSYSDENTVLIISPAWDGSSMARAMRQFWLGVNAALEDPYVDWVMSVEEETVLAPDALRFTMEMASRYSGDPAFRGINLGSIETLKSHAGTYSLQRYGFHGAGGALSRKTWMIARAIAGRRKRRLDAFDCQVEAYLKTGFMVTPNLSKYVNFGWIGGTNIPDTPEVRERFATIEESWKAEHPRSSSYRLLQVRHAWRDDCVPYHPKDSPRYWAKFLIGLAPIDRLRVRNTLSQLSGGR